MLIVKQITGVTLHPPGVNSERRPRVILLPVLVCKMAPIFSNKHIAIARISLFTFHYKATRCLPLISSWSEQVAWGVWRVECGNCGVWSWTWSWHTSTASSRSSWSSLSAVRRGRTASLSWNPWNVCQIIGKLWTAPTTRILILAVKQKAQHWLLITTSELHFDSETSYNSDC